jgi:hypothetical protein
MPAKSKAQQMAAGAALAAKKGEKPESELKGASRSMYDSMDQRQLEDFASTKQIVLDYFHPWSTRRLKPLP